MIASDRTRPLCAIRRRRAIAMRTARTIVRAVTVVPRVATAAMIGMAVTIRAVMVGVGEPLFGVVMQVHPRSPRRIDPGRRQPHHPTGIPATTDAGGASEGGPPGRMLDILGDLSMTAITHQGEVVD
ncbi:hypothetical protein, partial [Nocardia sp. CC227C]|uniref:hypothetical protein n=1 Tax=Nocardia sp. CC227C TaxID=3044562 RepID=UPI00278BDE33